MSLYLGSSQLEYNVILVYYLPICCSITTHTHKLSQLSPANHTWKYNSFLQGSLHIVSSYRYSGKLRNGICVIFVLVTQA